MPLPATVNKPVGSAEKLARNGRALSFASERFECHMTPIASMPASTEALIRHLDARLATRSFLFVNSAFTAPLLNVQCNEQKHYVE